MINDAMNIGQNKKGKVQLTIKPEFEPAIFLTEVLKDGQGLLDLSKIKASFIKWYQSDWSSDASTLIRKAFEYDFPTIT